MPFSFPDVSNALVVDLLIGLLVLLYVYEDVRRGALAGLVDLGGFAAALLAALLFYPRVGDLVVERVGLPLLVARPLAFGLTWLAADLVWALTIRRAFRAPARLVADTAVGKLGGVLTGVARGALVAALTLSVLAALPIPEPVGAAIRESRVGSALDDRSLALQQALGELLDDAVQQTIGMLTVRPDSSERIELPFTVERARIDEPAEDRMLELVNRERATAGLSALVVDPTIRSVAREYSSAMFRGGFFAHIAPDGTSPFDRMRAGGARFGAAGENLALAPTVDVAHDGLMKSPGHRANILNGRYRRVGIGVADGGMHGKMFTQNFAD